MVQPVTVQKALTSLFPIRAGEVTPLRQLLTQIGSDIAENPHLRWGDSPATHFARLVVLDAGSDNIASLQKQPPRLLFTSNYDGDFATYMRELVEQFGAQMEPIWSRCEGYPAGASSDVGKFSAWVEAHSLPSNTFYIACRGVSVAAIRQAVRIRRALDGLVSARDAQEAWRNLLQNLPASALPPRFENKGEQSKLADFAEWLVGIRGGKNPNKPVLSPRKQLGIEDRVTQNQMTVIVPIRRNPRSWLLVRLVLWAVNLVAGQSNGSLSGLTTIHFARWAIIDGGRNLFFESNFDGSWENYIDDFVDRASLGMNLIWGNCAGFPRGGCKDIEWFKQYIRDNQIPAQIFYSAYPQSSIKNNLNDLQIARAVRQFVREEEIDLFLSGSYSLGVTRALNTPLKMGANGPLDAVPKPFPARQLAIWAAAAALLGWLAAANRKS